MTVFDPNKRMISKWRNMLSKPAVEVPTTRPRRIRKQRTKTRVHQLQIYIKQQERPPCHMRTAPDSEERFRILTRRDYVPQVSRPRFEVTRADLENGYCEEEEEKEDEWESEEEED